MLPRAYATGLLYVALSELITKCEIKKIKFASWSNMLKTVDCLEILGRFAFLVVIEDRKEIVENKEERLIYRSSSAF